MSDDGIEGTAYRWARRALIVIGALGVLGAFALTLLIATGGGWFRGREPARVETAQPGRGFTIGNVTAIPGTPFVRIDVSEGEGRGGGSYSYSADDQRNVVVLDGRTGRSWRLMPDNNRRIEAADWFPATATDPDGQAADTLEAVADAVDSPDRGQSKPIAYFTFLVAAERGYDLIAGTIDGSRSAIVLRGIDGLDRSWMRGGNQLALIVRQGGKLSYRLIDMNALKVIGERGIAIE